MFKFAFVVVAVVFVVG